MTYESNVLFTLRWMVDAGVVGGSWIELPAGSWIRRMPLMTFCQIEVHVRHDRVISHPPEGDFVHMGPHGPHVSLSTNTLLLYFFEICYLKICISCILQRISCLCASLAIA
jgi:DNA polymerase family B, exonuclease domain